MEKQTVQLVLPANLQLSSVVRHVAEEIFASIKFSKAWNNRLKLVIDELFMNAVLYGSLENKSKIYLNFSYNDQEASFSIEDEGTGKNSVSVEELKQKILKNVNDANLVKTSGRGLSMIVQLWTDSVEIEKSEYGGIKISCTKKLDSSVPPKPPTPPAPVSVAPAPAPVKADGPTNEIKLSGEIDQFNIDEKVAPIYSKIEEISAGSNLALDFADVSYINSTVIGNLAAMHQKLQEKNGKITIKNANDAVKDVLDLVGLNRVIDIS